MPDRRLASKAGDTEYKRNLQTLERGFAYVALSRAPRRDTCYHFGRIRRTDWLPAVGDRANEQTTRSVWSEASLLLVFLRVLIWSRLACVGPSCSYFF